MLLAIHGLFAVAAMALLRSSLAAYLRRARQARRAAAANAELERELIQLGAGLGIGA